MPRLLSWAATPLHLRLPLTRTLRIVYSETNAIALALWDADQKNTLRIDLWTKDMEVPDMKRFYIDCIGGMAQSVLNATGDEFMSQEMNALCDKLVIYLQKEGEQ